MSPFVIVNQSNHSVCIKKPSISNMLNSDEDSFPDILGSLMQVPSSPEHSEYEMAEKKASFLPLAPINDAPSPYSPPIERRRLANAVTSENEFQSPPLSSEELEEGSFMPSPISSGTTTPFVTDDDDDEEEEEEDDESNYDMNFVDEIKAAEWLVNLSSSFSVATTTTTTPTHAIDDNDVVVFEPNYNNSNSVVPTAGAPAFPVLSNITNTTRNNNTNNNNCHIGLPVEYSRSKPRARGFPINNNNTPSNSTKTSKKRLRIRTTPYQLDVLKAAFLVDTMPNSQKRISLAKTLGMTPRRVQVWFQNQRAKEKRSM